MANSSSDNSTNDTAVSFSSPMIEWLMSTVVLEASCQAEAKSGKVRCRRRWRDTLEQGDVGREEGCCRGGGEGKPSPFTAPTTLSPSPLPPSRSLALFEGGTSGNCNRSAGDPSLLCVYVWLSRLV
ncbi:hypothetical protein C7M84_009668 [Penaeus vannamei]|uniref:Uncharacterized protein n=1 Tax=Penaeus vannamei TaxID=6689 RepID=A0A3R7MXH4_PENVA|nr:hypothetical protein C7M84_009668 [Penaeus vannamei]